MMTPGVANPGEGYFTIPHNLPSPLAGITSDPFWRWSCLYYLPQAWKQWSLISLPRWQPQSSPDESVVIAEKIIIKSFGIWVWLNPPAQIENKKKMQQNVVEGRQSHCLVGANRVYFEEGTGTRCVLCTATTIFLSSLHFFMKTFRIGLSDPGWYDKDHCCRELSSVITFYLILSKLVTRPRSLGLKEMKALVRISSYSILPARSGQCFKQIIIESHDTFLTFLLL